MHQTYLVNFVLHISDPLRIFGGVVQEPGHC
jgi:hypothetical protein